MDETKWTTTHIKYNFYLLHSNLAMVMSCETLSSEIPSEELFGGSLDILVLNRSSRALKAHVTSSWVLGERVTCVNPGDQNWPQAEG